MTPETNRKLTWTAVVVAGTTSFAAVMAGNLHFVLTVLIGGACLGAGLSLGLAIRKWKGDL